MEWLKPHTYFSVLGLESPRPSVWQLETHSRSIFAFDQNFSFHICLDLGAMSSSTPMVPHFSAPGSCFSHRFLEKHKVLIKYKI